MVKVCPSCKRDFQGPSRQKYCSRSCINTGRYAAKMGAAEEKIVWSCGGGMQSTAIAALVALGRLPRPDIAVMVDCGYERDTTWTWVYEELMPRLRACGVELHIIESADWTNNDLIQSGIVALPAFKRGAEGKQLKCFTACNETWKVKATIKYLRSLGVEKAVNWIGIDGDEKKRARETFRQWIRLAYPLLDLGLTRDGCRETIREAGWPMPPKTACYCCPNMSDDEWRGLSDADAERAAEVERAIQAHNPAIWLHRSMRPINEVLCEIRNQSAREGGYRSL